MKHLFHFSPGFRPWPTNWQQFPYAVTWVTCNQEIEFVISGAKLRIDKTTLRLYELTYPAMLSEMSKGLQAFDASGNANHRMEMAKETFSVHGETRDREPTEAEQNAMRG